MKGSMRILLTLLGIVVVTVAVVFVVVRPLGQRVAADQEAIRDRRDQLVKLQRVARRIDDLQEEIKRLEDALAFFEDRLPQEREIEVILREVWVTAEARSLAARSIRTMKVEAAARYNAQPISLTLEGPFAGFYEFLLCLEQLPRITKVREMQIQKSPTEPGAVLVDMVVDIFFEN
jgi:Tfp pilus assembly protein PilO